MNQQGSIVFANERARNRLGYTLEELRGKSLVDLAPVHYTPETLQTKLETLRNHAPSSFLSHHQDSEGNLIPVRIEVDLVKKDSESYFLAISRPIDELVDPDNYSPAKMDVDETGDPPLAMADSGQRAYPFTSMDFGLNQELLSKTRDEIYIFDTDTARIVEVNETVPRKLGYTRAELLDMTIMDVVEEFETLDEWTDRIETYRSGETEPKEGHHVRKDGTTYPVEASSTLIEHNNREYLVSVARDISELQQRRRETEELFNAVNDVITVHDPETEELIDVNETACEMLGYDKETLLELGIEGISDHDDGFTAAKSPITAEPDELPDPFEWACRTADGEVLWLEVNPVVMERNGQRRFLAISRDITERKKDRAELEFQTSVLKAQQEAADEGILVVSTDGEILSYNQTFQELWDIPDEVLETQRDSDAVDYVLDQLKNPEEFQETVEYLYDNPRDRRRDELRLTDGTILERYSGPVLLDDQVVGRVWYFRDITERRRIQDELEQSLEEKTTLLAEIHHRVKNNIQIIASMLKLQMRDQDSDVLREEYEDSISRLETMALVHEKLYQTEHLAEVNLPAYVRDLCERILITHGREETVTIRYDVEDLSLDISHSIACGLLINELVSNALEHGLPDRTEGEIDVEVTQEGEEVCLRVRDSGRGLDGDVDFDQPDTTGLKIVSSLVDYDLNGRLEYEDGEGLEVRVFFRPD